MSERSERSNRVIRPRNPRPEAIEEMREQRLNRSFEAIKRIHDRENQFIDAYGEVLGPLSISWMRAENNLTHLDGRRVKVDSDFLCRLGMALAEQVNGIPEEERGQFLGQYLQDCRQFKR